MGVDATRSMNAEFFASKEAAADDASSATPMARRTSSTDGCAGRWGAAKPFCPVGARRRMMRRAGSLAEEADAEAVTVQRGARMVAAAAPVRPRGQAMTQGARSLASSAVRAETAEVDKVVFGQSDQRSGSEPTRPGQRGAESFQLRNICYRGCTPYWFGAKQLR
jgi:hypothetical protein